MSEPTVLEYFNGLNETKGDVGVEIEYEGTNLPGGSKELSKFWRIEEDGSLRGPENAEYVLRRPVEVSEVTTALRALHNCMKKAGTKINDTVRAGVHVHINVQDMNFKELLTFMTCYFSLEDLLISFCGEGRKGNHFCLGAGDAEALLYHLNIFIDRKSPDVFYDDNFRYSAMNVTSISRYGSLEFRALRSTYDLERINQWVNILFSIKEGSRKFKNPKEVVESMSMDGGYEFARTLLGDNLNSLGKNPNEISVLVLLGTRHAQDIAFQTDWDSFTLKKRE